jgi:hypothetical protein
VCDCSIRNIIKECKFDVGIFPSGEGKYDELAAIINSLELQKAPGHD